MYLTLTITRGPGNRPRDPVSKVFDQHGGTIGRGAGNDWVLPDPDRFLSSHHAAIYCEDQTFFLADTSTNGVFVNGSPEALGSGRVIALNPDDRLSLGEYELTVTGISGEAAAQGDDLGVSAANLAGVAAGLSKGGLGYGLEGVIDPLQLLGAAPAPLPPATPRPALSPASPEASPPPRWDVGTLPAGNGEILDPLHFLENPLADVFNPPPAAPELHPGGRRHGEMPEPDHSSLLDDHFSPPTASFEVIPEDWDLDGPVATAPAPTAAPEPEAQPITAGPPTDELASLLFGESVPEAPPPTTAPASAAAPLASRQELPAAVVPAQMPRDSVEHTAGTDALYRFLEGAGLDHSLAARLEESGSSYLVGQLFRQFVEGLCEVLAARAQFKSALRLDVTVIAPSGNNPLKFAAGGVDEAIEKLLANRSKGYLDPIEAVREGFQNIKDHDLALISGLRASFSALLHRFDPADIEEHVGKSGIRSLLNNRKAQCWDAYLQEFQEVKKLSDNDFEAFFKDAFAEAYEAQIDRLSGAKR